MKPARPLPWWLATVIAAGLSMTAPVASQPPGGAQPPFAGDPIKEPEVPTSGREGASPLGAAEILRRHFEERKKRLAEPLTVPDDPVKAAAELRRVMTDLACVIAIEDIAGDLRRYAQRTHPRDSDDRKAFDAEFEKLKQAMGTPEQRADLRQKAQDKIDALRKAAKDQRERSAIMHELYHWSTTKKAVELAQLHLSGLFRPLDAWRTIDCPGEECVIGGGSGVPPAGTRPR